MHDPLWRTRDGQVLRIGEMSTDHVMNCIRLIERLRGWRREYLERLRLELVIRRVRK